MHSMLKPGETLVINSPTQEDGEGWLKIKAAFGDARVRVSVFHLDPQTKSPLGWAEIGDLVDDGTGRPAVRVVVKDAARHWWTGLDPTHDALTIQNEGPGLVAVSIRPRRAYGS